MKIGRVHAFDEVVRVLQEEPQMLSWECAWHILARRFFFCLNHRVLTNCMIGQARIAAATNILCNTPYEISLRMALCGVQICENLNDFAFSELILGVLRCGISPRNTVEQHGRLGVCSLK